MQINHIKISNILGIDQLELSPQGFTQISGPNGTGKTSVIEAIKGALKSGHDATLLRNGTDKGEVVLVLDDGMEISKTVTESASNTAVRRDGKKISRPAETIKALTDALSVNPIDFLLAKPKERASVLLDAMPLEADASHLSEVVGFQVQAQPGLHALHVIDAVRRQVYENRTGTNRALTEKKATINQLEAAVPPAPDGVGDDEATLEAQQQKADADYAVTTEKIENHMRVLQSKHDDALSGVRANLQAKIDELKAAAVAEADALHAAIADKKEKAAAAREKALSDYNVKLQPIKTQLQIVRNDREAAGRRKQTLETIANLQTELKTLEEESAQQTGALEAIDRYKNDLLVALPIHGVEIRDGEIYRDNIIFDRLNTAQQVDIAIEVAKLRAADLGIICVDGLELMDSKTLAEFKARAIADGLQMFVTRVSDAEFKIQTD